METRRNSQCSLNNEEEDRISNLPDHLIHHILSFLDMTYVTPTSILSRRWRYLWTSLPTLNFNSHRIVVPDRRIDHFVVFVERLLVLREYYDMQRFKFTFREITKVDYDGTSHFNTWILAAVRHNVQELSADVMYFAVQLKFQFPPCLFTCKSLTKLELSLRCQYQPEVILPNSMCLPRLKYLRLYGLTIKDDKLADKLFSSCPVLESLIIARCTMNLNISSLTLKHFEFEKREFYSSDSVVGTVKLCAPNLTSFTCYSYTPQDYSLENLSSLVTAKIEMVEDEDDEETSSELSTGENETYARYTMKLLKALHNVKDLTLSAWFLEVLSGTPGVLDSQTAAFGNLRSLKLQSKLSRDCFRAVAYLLKISPLLESLTLKCLEDEDEDDAEDDSDNDRDSDSDSDRDSGKNDNDNDNDNGDDENGDDSDEDEADDDDDDYDYDNGDGNGEVDDDDEDGNDNEDDEISDDDDGGGDDGEDEDDCTSYSFCDEKKLHSTNIGDYLEAELPLPCMLYHLKLVGIRGLIGCVSELKFLEILLKNAMVLEKVVLDSCSCERHNRKFCRPYCKQFSRHTERRMSKFTEKLQTLPRASSSIEILVL